VQGAILARLDGLDPALASACFADARFRAWPLLPVLGAEDVHDDVPFGVRVDLTHRLSKLPMEGGGHDVRDTAIKPYHWSEVAGGSPLKSSDGILRRHPDGTVTLWKAADMPRLITSHSVHLGSGPESKRSLFSVEALAPMVFSGLLAIPAEAAEAVRQALSSDPTICFGKARSIRGSGRLEVHPADPLADLLSGRFPDKPPGCVFVVQSPLLLPDDYQVGRAETALQYLAERAGWGTALLDCEETSGQSIARTAATCGIRFGWNRHGLGAKADERHRRLQAHRVILPGSVLVLRTPLTDTAAKLLAGLGDGRESGFGALLPHPGMAASEPYRPRRPPVTLGSRDEAGRRALLLFTTAGKADGPSPSQISAVGRRIGKGADAYLDKQAGRGGVRHWHRWEPVFGDVKQVLCGDPDLARRVLRAWQDLAIIHRGTDKERRS
jgi:hypothetical protein